MKMPILPMLCWFPFSASLKMAATVQAPAQSKNQTYHHTLISCTHTHTHSMNVVGDQHFLSAACFRCMGQNSLCMSQTITEFSAYTTNYRNTRAYFSSNDCLIHIFVNRAAFPNAFPMQVNRRIHVQQHRSSLLESMFWLLFFPFAHACFHWTFTQITKSHFDLNLRFLMNSFLP